MYDHIGLKVKNLDASARFCKAVLAPLGHVPDSSGIGFGPAGGPDGNNIEAVCLEER